MYLLVDLGDPTRGVVLHDEDDFAAFKVLVEGAGGWKDLSGGLVGAARTDPPYAWVDVDSLRRLGRGDDATWVKQLDGMIDFATSKGWVDHHGAVRAHCEWASAPKT